MKWSIIVISKRRTVRNVTRFSQDCYILVLLIESRVLLLIADLI